ncbi:venom metalloproteinase antarease-like TtrivMP_A [Ixodes scapularis]
MNGKVLERNLYHDKHKLAVVEVKEKNGNVEVRGILSDTLRIVPLHLLVLAQEGPMAHKIFEVEASAHDGNDHIESNENKLQERADTIRFSPHKERKVPETFFVETLVVADQYLYRKFHNDTELIIYLATTMAAVNIRFANASDPKVGLLIVKIVKDPGTSFHRLFIGSAPGDQKKSLKIFANAPKTLSQFATKYQSSICDVALLVTGLELAETKGSSVSRLLKGLAYIDGLCQPMLHFGEVGDIPHTYSMLSAAAHEIGHILGMTHDGEIPSYPVPNVTWLRCDATLGYLMAPVLGGRNEGFFSNCSLQHMRILVSQQTDACYKVQSKTATEAPSRLPGVGLNMADLCKILHPGVGGMDGMLFQLTAVSRESPGCFSSCIEVS